MRLFKSPSKKMEAVQFAVEPPKRPVEAQGIAIAVMVRNEGESIAEWLAFHKAAGVDRFILYDDDCTDDTIDIAHKVLPSDALTVVPWRQRIQDIKMGRTIHNQGLAFAHAVANFHDKARWMAFIDVDEFLFPTKADSITAVLSDLDDVDNILVPWAMFGRQGLSETPATILPHYTQRYHDPYLSPVKGVLNFKCIVNPAKVTKAYVHGFETSGTTAIWNSRGERFTYGDHREPAFNANPALQLNHYYSKSDAQLNEKINKGSIGDSAFTRGFKTHAGRTETLSRRVEEIERQTVEDRGIIDFCDRIGFSFTSDVFQGRAS